jgi:glutamate-1-semialdehyde aminotransferase
MEPEVALVTAGVELDVLGVGYDDVPEAIRNAIVTAHPRPDFKRRILKAFTEGLEYRPQTTFGNVKADLLERSVPGFERANFVEIIENSHWPE